MTHLRLAMFGACARTLTLVTTFAFAASGCGSDDPGGGPAETRDTVETQGDASDAATETSPSEGADAAPELDAADTSPSEDTDATSGSSHSCGRRGGTLYCWGLNDAGQVGNDTLENVVAPVLISAANDWSAIAAGTKHTCGVRGTNLYCWGQSSAAQLGIANGLTPQLIAF